MLRYPLKRIAITGSLSCGKSSACRFFQELSAYVVSADEIAHELLSKPEMVRALVDLLGQQVFSSTDHSQIDRTKVAALVFGNADLLRKLEKLLHPAISEEIDSQYQKACQNPNYTLFVAEIPLLFETGADRYYDATIAVVSPLEQCIERFKKKTGYSELEYHKRMDHQLPIAIKMARATYRLENNGSLQQMKDAVKRLYNQLVA